MPITSITFGGETYRVVGSIQLTNPERKMPEPKPKVAIRIPSVLDFLHPKPGHVHEADKPKRRAESTPSQPLNQRGEVQPVTQQRRETGMAVADAGQQTPEEEVRHGCSAPFLRMTALLACGWRRVRPMAFPLRSPVFPRQWHWARPSHQPQDARNFGGTDLAFAQLEGPDNRIPVAANAEQMVVILMRQNWTRIDARRLGRAPTPEEWEWQTPEFEGSPPVRYLSTREAYHEYLCGVDVPYSLADATEPTVQILHALIPTRDENHQHEALMENGWQRVTPPGSLEGVPVQAMSYYWRRPGVGGRSRGRLYRSTQQAYNQLRRDRCPVPLQANGQAPPF